MNYPSRQDITIAVQNLKQSVLDDELKNGTLQKLPNGRVVTYSGGFSLVFPIDIESGRYALRCWIGDIGNSEDRYAHIFKYLEQLNSNYFAKFKYVKNGIIVKGEKWPIIKMEWVKGMDLKSYIENNLTNPSQLEALAEKFLDLVKFLHQQKIAHGDLQHGNIIIDEQGKLRLIDYDSLFVAGLETYDDKIKGYPDYQHPNRKDNAKTNAKLDYFSELVIYLSIRILAKKPELWKKYNLGKRENQLYFDKEDYLNFTNSVKYKEVISLDKELDILLKELGRFCKEKDILSLIPLEDTFQLFKATIEYFRFEKIRDESFLSWKVQNVDTVKINDIEGLGLEGKLNITNLKVTKVFKLVCHRKESNETLEESREVKVGKIISFSSDEHIVYEGKKIQLSWEVADAKRISIKGIGDFSKTPIGSKNVIANNRILAYELIVEGDTNQIIQTLPLHFIKMPKIEILTIPQPNFSPILFKANLQELNLNFSIPFSKYFREIKKTNLYFKSNFKRLEESRTKINANILTVKEILYKDNNFQSLKNSLGRIKDLIKDSIENQINN